MANKSNDTISRMKRILLCVVAGLIMAFNIKSFVRSGDLLPGGFSGLTILIQSVVMKFGGVSIPYGPIYIGLNLFPVILSFKKIGKRFTAYSCITIAIVAFLTDFIPSFDITSDVLLVSIFGGLISGVAISLCLNAGATSGGTDFISIYISERFKIDAWNYILLFNVFVLTCDGFLFGWDKALYSMIFQYVSTQVVNTIYKRYKKDTLFVVTEHPHEVAEVISKLTNHGATRMNAEGMYEGKKKSMVYSVIDSSELTNIMEEIRKIDPDAFINAIRTDRISGRFYMRPQD
ncbi:MAG: YitT family protein [Saccharofermentans sp.]|nr:YitT family protein [Saccharofermentans sp.]